MKPKRPKQERAKRTFELILDTAADLIDEAGFDRLTTNKICDKAGISPPALYNYFSDKYAILLELAERLMTAQNKYLAAWLREVGKGPIDQAQLTRMLKGHLKLDNSFRSSRAIYRSLHSVPSLSQAWRESLDEVCELLVAWQMDRTPHADEAKVRTRSTIIVEMGASVLELITNDRDLDENAICEEAAFMMAPLYERLAS